MLWVFADCLKLMVVFCSDFGFFEWFLGGGRSSNSVVFGGTCKKWTCSTMTSWRKVANMKSTFFVVLKLLFFKVVVFLKLLLFYKKWRSRHCFALHFDFLKNWSIFVTKRFLHALFWQIFFRSVFSILFFFAQLTRSGQPASRAGQQPPRPRHRGRLKSFS